jgi:hypothetical protein
MAPDVEPAERLSDLLARLYHLHEHAQDPHLELWPDGDAIGVLAYTRAHHSALPPEQVSPARREQIRLRLKVTELLGRLIDTEQLGALDQARPPGARRGEHLLTLADLAKVLGLSTPGAVSHRRDRLYAARHHRPRTPWHGRQLMAKREARRVDAWSRWSRHGATTRGFGQRLKNCWECATTSS